MFTPTTMPTTTEQLSKAPVNIKAVSRQVWRQAKAAAALEGMTLSEFIERALQEAVRKSTKGR